MNICFTGHRPNKLYGYDLDNKKYYDLGTTILGEVLEIINNSSDKQFTFYFGGALGVDQLAFEWIRHLKENQLQLIDCKNLSRKIHIKMIMSIPFEKQYIKWQYKDVERWRNHFFYADENIFVDTLEKYKFDKVSIGEYHPAKMQLRNQYMVDNSDIVIAIWDGSSGGTGNCVRYAKKMNKEIVIINPKEI